MMNNTCRMSSTEKKEEGNNKRSPIHNGSTLNLGWSESKDTANMKLRLIQTRMYLIWKKQIKVISRLKCTQYSGIVSPVCAHVGRHALRYLYCNLSHCCIMPSYTIYILEKTRIYIYQYCHYIYNYATYIFTTTHFHAAAGWLRNMILTSSI